MFAAIWTKTEFEVSTTSFHECVCIVLLYFVFFIFFRVFFSFVAFFLQYFDTVGKMVNGFRFYRALESVSIASALSTALTIYPCQIRVYQRWQSKLQLPTARKKEWRPATAGSSPHAVTCQQCDTHYFLPVNCPPDNLHCLGGDVKPCSINQSINQSISFYAFPSLT